jgi:hypothetical protein
VNPLVTPIGDFRLWELTGAAVTLFWFGVLFFRRRDSLWITTSCWGILGVFVGSIVTFLCGFAWSELYVLLLRNFPNFLPRYGRWWDAGGELTAASCMAGTSVFVAYIGRYLALRRLI